jgi:antitoxin FitA
VAEVSGMHQITIRDVDDSLNELLKQRAARHGRTIESEAASILRAALAAPPGDSAPAAGNLGDAIRAIVEPLGGFELQIPERKMGSRDLPDFR